MVAPLPLMVTETLMTGNPTNAVVDLFDTGVGAELGVLQAPPECLIAPRMLYQLESEGNRCDNRMNSKSATRTTRVPKWLVDLCTMG